MRSPVIDNNPGCGMTEFTRFPNFSRVHFARMGRQIVIYCFVVALLALSLQPLLWAQNCYSTDQPGRPADKVRWAHDFLYSFFPEFDSYREPTFVTVTDRARFGYFRSCNFYVFTANLRTRNTDPSTYYPEIAFASDSEFNFRRDSLLSEWKPTDLPKKLIDMRKLVNSHPEWKEADIHRELALALAQYLPENRDEFIQSLPLDKLRILFGDVRVTEADFVYRDSDDPPTARLCWRVVIQLWRDGKFHHSYAFLAEPFAGKPFTLRLLDSPQSVEYNHNEKPSSN